VDFQKTPMGISNPLQIPEYGAVISTRCGDIKGGLMIVDLVFGLMIHGSRVWVDDLWILHFFLIFSGMCLQVRRPSALCLQCGVEEKGGYIFDCVVKSMEPNPYP